MSTSDNSLVPFKYFAALYICSWRGFKRRLMMYSAHALSLVKVCDVLVVLFKAVVTFHLASAGVVRAVWMPVDRLLSKGFTSTPYYFSFHLWFVIFERAVFAFSIRQSSLSLCPLFLFFFFSFWKLLYWILMKSDCFRALRLAVKVLSYSVICRCKNSVLLQRVHVCIFFFSSTSLVI